MEQESVIGEGQWASSLSGHGAAQGPAENYGDFDFGAKLFLRTRVLPFSGSKL